MATFAGTVPFVAHSRVPRGAHWSGTFSYHVFSLTLGGGATYSLPSGLVDIMPGDLLHFAPRAMQDWRVGKPTGWHVGYVIVDLPARFSDMFSASELAPGIGRTRLDAREIKRITQVFRDMQDWNERSTPVREQLVHNLLEYVLLSVFRGPTASNTDVRIQQAQDFLHRSVESPVVLADVTRAAGLSRARLCAMFKEQLATTPMVYLERLRLEHAARLLRFTTEGIEKIAERIGYHERGYFDKRFKRRWGVTPRAYRLNAN